MTNGLINSNDFLNRTIYCILALFFSLIFWFSKNIYNTNIELQNKIQDMSIVMSKLTYTIDSTNQVLNTFQNDFKEMKKDISRLEREMIIIKNSNK